MCQTLSVRKKERARKKGERGEGRGFLFFYYEVRARVCCVRVVRRSSVEGRNDAGMLNTLNIFLKKENPKQKAR